MKVDIRGLGVWDWQLTRGKLEISPEWLELTGYSREDIPDIPVGDNYLEDLINLWVSYIHPEDKEEARLEVVKYLILYRNGSKTYSNYFRFRKKDGDYIPIFSTGFGEWDENGKLYRFRVTHTDFSDTNSCDRALFAHMGQVENANSKLQDSMDKISTQLARFKTLIKVGVPAIMTGLITISGFFTTIWEAVELFYTNLSDPVQATSSDHNLRLGDPLTFEAFEERRDKITEVLQQHIGSADRAIFAYYEPGSGPTQGRIGAQAKRESVKWIKEDPWQLEGWDLIQERLEVHLQGNTFTTNSAFSGLFDARQHVSVPGFWMSDEGIFVHLPIVWYVAVECSPNNECDMEAMEKDAIEAKEEIVKIFEQR